MKKVCFFGFFPAIWLCFCGPAYASEDPETFELPTDFTFGNLPDIEPLDVETNESLPPPASMEAVSETMPQQTSLPEEMPLPADEEVEDIYIPSANNPPADAFSEDRSLTETLKEDAAKQTSSPLEGTWVEKITSSNPLSLLTADKSAAADDEADEEEHLEDMIQGARGNDLNGRSNASVFDVAGVMLRMNLYQAERTLQKRGFRKINARFQIPNFIKWRNEEACRREGVVGYERLEACVIDKAKEDGYEYMEYLKYAKFDSKEEIEVYFTSNFTDNKVYKIVYRSRIATITGNSPKAIYIRNIKVYDFWKKINQKYGQPDNKTTVTWGLGGDKPYLKADTGYLLLEDPMFRELDYTRMSREDQRFIHSDFYNF